MIEDNIIWSQIVVNKYKMLFKNYKLTHLFFKRKFLHFSLNIPKNKIIYLPIIYIINV